MNEMPREQTVKLNRLEELRTLLVQIVDNQIDMYRDDISSISDAYENYDIAGDIGFFAKFLENDEQLIDPLRAHIAANGWTK